MNSHLRNSQVPSRTSNIKWILNGVLYLLVSVALSVLILTIVYRWINPPYTWLMVERYFQTEKTKLDTIQQEWVSIEKISPNIMLAVVTAEDNLFLTHWGFDFESIKQAREEKSLGIRLRGASTISMQVSKNVFLWHGRTWTRKFLEAGFTILIETLWGKKRIMEVYLNIAEFGPSVYGVEVASKQYFNKSASELNRDEAALLATVLPNPLYRNPNKPSRYMLRYQERVLRNMQNIGEITFD